MYLIANGCYFSLILVVGYRTDECSLINLMSGNIELHFSKTEKKTSVASLVGRVTRKQIEKVI